MARNGDGGLKPTVDSPLPRTLHGQPSRSRPGGNGQPRGGPLPFFPVTFEMLVTACPDRPSSDPDSVCSAVRLSLTHLRTIPC